jgi:hypothetical protein
MEIISVEAEISMWPTDGRTEREDKANNRFSNLGENYLKS